LQGGYGAGSRSAPTPDGHCLRVPQRPVFPSDARFFALCAPGFAAGEGSPAWELPSSTRASPAGKGHELHRGLREKVLTLRSDFEERMADKVEQFDF